MPIYTPRGLKIRLDPVHAFTLLARLEPTVPPIDVLRTTEAVENATSLAGVLAAAIAITVGGSIQSIFWSTFLAVTAVGGMNRYGIFLVPGLIWLSRLFSHVSGWGIFFVVLVVYAWVTVGWLGAAAYVGGRLAAGSVNWILELQRGRYYMRVVGHPLTASEINFFSAYRLHAKAIGASIDIDVTDEDETEYGTACLNRFADEHPDIAANYVGGEG